LKCSEFAGKINEQRELSGWNPSLVVKDKYYKLAIRPGGDLKFLKMT